MENLWVYFPQDIVFYNPTLVLNDFTSKHFVSDYQCVSPSVIPLALELWVMANLSHKVSTCSIDQLHHPLFLAYKDKPTFSLVYQRQK